jgi:4'-phosphopantetheinyl transferase EntD
VPQPELDELTRDLFEDTGVATVIEAVKGDHHLDELPGVAPAVSRLSLVSQLSPVSLLSPARSADLVRGRLACAEALRRSGQASPPPGLEGVPRAIASLTHAGGWAFAVAVVAAPHPERSGPSGIGIDFEPTSARLAPEAARFFLTRRELSSFQRLSHQVDLLSLWTIKEACFKADPDNDGHQLRDYQIADLTASRGRVGHPHHPAQPDIRYVCRLSDLGPITLAVAGIRADQQERAEPRWGEER